MVMEQSITTQEYKINILIFMINAQIVYKTNTNVLTEFTKSEL